ncbi:MAG: putative transcriptional regulator, MarR family [Rhodospirillales bacterium]|nr:putative transcriptional regulator, MarR family [Rhodospirillales bacterium]
MKPGTKVRLILDEFRKLDPELPAQQAVALIVISERAGMTQQKVAAQLGVSKSSANRIFNKLADEGTDGKVGLGLIKILPGDADARERQAYLTPTGVEFLANLCRIVEA